MDNPQNYFDKNPDFFLHKFCSINEKSAHINYSVFKHVANDKNYDIITHFIVKSLKSVLDNYELFTIHLSLKSLTMTDLTKHQKYIVRVCNLFKHEFQDKLDVCFIYDAPFVFSQFIAIVSKLVDKKTQNKIQVLGRDGTNSSKVF